jgi:hypothetical protein
MNFLKKAFNFFVKINVLFDTTLVYLETLSLLINYSKMKKIAVLLLLSLGVVFDSMSQEGCFERLEKAFNERGSYTISDDIHRNVIVVFFDKDNESTCVKGKARVENGAISSIFIYFDDNTSELYDKKFHNAKRQPPRITDGISEMIFTTDGERIRIVFVDKIKPRKKQFKEAVIPDDL